MWSEHPVYEICRLVLQTCKANEQSQENELIDNDSMYQFFKNKASGKYADKILTDFTWGRLEKVVCKYFPSFSNFVEASESRKKLSKKEWHVVLLVRLHFTTSEMVNVLSASPTSISNAKQMANEKLYGDKNAKTLLYNIQHELPL